MGTKWITVPGVILRGYGVASGSGSDDPSSGTIRAQLAHFRDRGLDLSHCFPGTLNVSIAPRYFSLHHPRHTFTAVRWSPWVEAETFSFSPCQVVMGDARVAGFVYYPHPETKPDHFHPPTVVEVIAPFIEGLAYDSHLELALDPSEVTVT